MRAAVAKATPRASNSEEKALAAKEARERHLAQVAAACAEEVRRAKKIAEDMKERKAAEERRYRLEMEEKHAEAERRRQEYKRSPRRPRTASSPPAEPGNAARPSSAPTSEDAAKRIQAAWRARSRKNIVDAWLETGLSIEKISSTSFEDITAMLADEKLLQMTEKVMELFVLLPDPDPAARSTAVRTFLSAYLILGHPTNVLSRDGDQEQDLITNSHKIRDAWKKREFEAKQRRDAEKRRVQEAEQNKRLQAEAARQRQQVMDQDDDDAPKYDD